VVVLDIWSLFRGSFMLQKTKFGTLKCRLLRFDFLFYSNVVFLIFQPCPKTFNKYEKKLFLDLHTYIERSVFDGNPSHEIVEMSWSREFHFFVLKRKWFCCHIVTMLVRCRVTKNCEKYVFVKIIIFHCLNNNIPFLFAIFERTNNQIRE